MHWYASVQAFNHTEPIGTHWATSVRCNTEEVRPRDQCWSLLLIHTSPPCSSARPANLAGRQLSSMARSLSEPLCRRRWNQGSGGGCAAHLVHRDAIGATALLLSDLIMGWNVGASPRSSSDGSTGP